MKLKPNFEFNIILCMLADVEGNVPLREAIMGKHESVIKLLLDNNAEITNENVGDFACAIVEQNNLELLKEISQYVSDISLPKANGTTALHAAVCEGNNEIVRFLLKQGADFDKPDVNGWTPRALADHQGHEEIKEMFQNNINKIKKPSFPISVPKDPTGSRFTKYMSEPNIPPYNHDATADNINSHRRRACNYSNSLVGMMFNANIGKSMHVFHFVPIRSILLFGDKLISPCYFSHRFKHMFN